MKISKLFHWLYCAVMFLPLFVLPIFALVVRSDNNYQPIEITTGGYEIVDKYSSNEVNNLSDLVNNNIYRFNDTLELAEIIDVQYRLTVVSGPVYCESVGFRYDGEVFSSNLISFLIDSSYSPYVNYGDGYYSCSSFEIYDSSIIQVDNYYNFNHAYNGFTGHDFAPSTFVYTDYNEKIVIYSEEVVLNDTDFGSQTIYTLYKEVDYYFNYDNVFNFGDLYSWLNITFFNGSAPLGFFIFWHLLIYWLLTSLLWLLFDVLMYVPQLIHRWLDKASLS